MFNFIFIPKARFSLDDVLNEACRDDAFLGRFFDGENIYYVQDRRREADRFGFIGFGHHDRSRDSIVLSPSYGHFEEGKYDPRTMRLYPLCPDGDSVPDLSVIRFSHYEVNPARIDMRSVTRGDLVEAHFVTGEPSMVGFVWETDSGDRTLTLSPYDPDMFFFRGRPSTPPAHALFKYKISSVPGDYLRIGCMNRVAAARDFKLY